LTGLPAGNRIPDMENMNNANISKGEEKKEDLFAEMMETVFLFIHEHYGDFAAIQKSYEINYSQYAALITILLYGSIVEGELAKLLFINPSTASRMMYALEEKGWVRVERDKVDRRRVIVTLTPAGNKRMEEMRNQQAEVLTRQVESLDAEKREYVYGVAEFVNQALRYMMVRSSGGEGA
jgi:DNA-binding MarR family transcriptional regulator